jgi:uncharacterized protein YjbJ (UPF0337 family)
MAGKKAKAAATKAKGKAQVVAGELTGSKKLKRKGHASKVKAGAARAKEKIKDAVR